MFLVKKLRKLFFWYALVTKVLVSVLYRFVICLDKHISMAELKSEKTDSKSNISINQSLRFYKKNTPNITIIYMPMGAVLFCIYGNQ